MDNPFKPLFKKINSVWQNMSMLMRLVLISGIVGGTYWYTDTYYIVPTQISLQEYQAKAKAEPAPENHEELLDGINQNIQKINKESRELQAKFDVFSKQLTPDGVSRVMNIIHEQLNDAKIRIVSESQAAAQNGTVPVFPPPIQYQAYAFSVYGSFTSLHLFLLNLNRAEGIFLIRGIRTFRSQQTIASEKGYEVPAIGLEFTVYIPFSGNAV